MAALTTPRQSGTKFVFEFGAAALEVDAAFGARVTSLTFEGRELLTGPEVEPVNFGSTFWPSPQSVWFWPPPPEIDSGPYDANLEGSVLTLTGACNLALGLSVSKRLCVDDQRDAVQIEYGIQNSGSARTQVAAWEITRLHPRGVTFYAAASPPYPNIDLPLPATTQVGDVTFLEYDPAKVTGHEKLLADGSEGWLAHASDGVLLVKTFDDIVREQAAPGEGEIEIYLDGKTRYLEIEQQGAHTTLEPGQSLSWTVRWHLERIPAGVPVAAGSQGLVALARAIRAR
jgi:hypothetical protein